MGLFYSDALSLVIGTRRRAEDENYRYSAENSEANADEDGQEQASGREGGRRRPNRRRFGLSY